ncbi:Swarming motility protein SwrC, partial [Gordoniibacillus kamchatkensis]
MRSLIRFSLHNKFAVLILTLIVAAGGMYAGMQMREETIPNLDVPILTVTTVIPGTAPQAVADQVTIPLEQRIKALPDVDQLNSTSQENVSSIVVQYRYGQDMAKAKADLQEAVSSVKLPQEAQPAKISAVSLNDFPVVTLSMSGDNVSLADMTRLVETDLRPALESIPGVGTVTISGQQLQEVQVRPDAAKLRAYGLSADTVRSAIQSGAVTVPLGLFEIDATEKTIVLDGGVHTLEQLRSLAIPLSAGGSRGSRFRAGCGWWRGRCRVCGGCGWRLG